MANLTSISTRGQVLRGAMLLSLVLAVHASFGGPHGDAVSEPKLLLRIISAIEGSKIERLTSRVYKDGDSEFSYHLKTVSYLGRIERAGESLTLATALFIRSSAKGSELPPPRGHGFLVCLDSDFRMRSHCRLDMSDYHIEEAKLKRGEEVIADFSAHDEVTRYKGFLVDGDDLLPYPFADRISEADWQSGAFRNKR